MRKLTREQIFAMHSELIAEYGGSDGLRDEGLFESAFAAPYQTFDGQDMLPTMQQKAVRLGYGLIMNHPFIDGNKRIGAHVLITTLALNGIELEYTQKDLYEIILDVASGKVAFEELLEWVLDHQD
ncbi:MAG: type II toxin-antitoxin system death-on-curing family toxin [Peptococcaceae bacterium]|jgi:death-on-curing protein|nr:type II toxin-antitoxin system death-on-curing family toxin [Peptococcaceae bacterium]